MALKRVLTFHRWLAIACAPMLILQALTGSALLFRDELQIVLEPSRLTGPSENASIAALYLSARDLHPGMRLSRLRLPAHPNGATFAHFSDAKGASAYALVDPASGAVITSGLIWRYPLEAALQLHYRLNAGQIGLALTTAYGLALALIAMTGLWHWWPGRQRALPSLKIPRRTPQRMKLRMWHRSTGAVAASLLIVVAVTGVLNAIPGLATPGPAPALPASFTAAEIETALALAEREFPQSTLRDIRFQSHGTLVFNFHAPRGGPWAIDTVRLNLADRMTVHAITHEANDALWTFTYPVHTGSIVGPVGRWLMLAVAAALVFLAISGPLQWLRNRHSKKPRK